MAGRPGRPLVGASEHRHRPVRSSAGSGYIGPTPTGRYGRKRSFTPTGPALTVETAETAIRDLIRTHELKRVKIEDIQKLVASHYSVSRADILSSRRTAAVVKPRQVAMFLAKMLTLRSLPEIGRRFGGRDHTTVLHAVRKIEALSQTDTTLREELELLKRMLQE